MYYFKTELLLPKNKLKKKKKRMNLSSFSKVESYFLSIGYCWIGEFVKWCQQTSFGGENIPGPASPTSAALEEKGQRMSLGDEGGRS